MGADEPVIEQHSGASKEQRGIHSMEVGGRLLRLLADAGQPLSMGALSSAANLPLNQVFTYVVSLMRTGLIKRDAVTHCYEPGPLSRTLGLHALSQLSPLREALRRAIEIAAATKHGVLVAVWGDRGPTLVQYVSPEVPLHTGMHVGAVMSMAHTSTGRIFAAYIPATTVDPMLASDIQKRDGNTSGLTSEELEELLLETRRRGLARTEGLPIPGVDSLSAPVFNGAGEIVLAVTVFGETGAMDMAWEGDPAKALTSLARELSSRGN